LAIGKSLTRKNQENRTAQADNRKRSLTTQANSNWQMAIGQAERPEEDGFALLITAITRDHGDVGDLEFPC